MTTIKELDFLVDRLNEIAQSEGEEYQLSGAYGGWKLVKKCKGGGTMDVTQSGFTTKPKLYREITSFLNGYSAAIDNVIQEGGIL